MSQGTLFLKIIFSTLPMKFLITKKIFRFVKEIETVKKGDKVTYRLYYTTDNSLEYHGETTSFFIIPKSSVKAVQTLFHRYPEYTCIDELPHQSYEEKVNTTPSFLEGFISNLNSNT